MSQSESYKTTTLAYSLTAAAFVVGGGAATGSFSTLYQPVPYKGGVKHADVQEASTGAKATEGMMSYDERLIDAKLEAVEARTETKFAQLMGEIKLISQSISDLSGKVGDVKTEVGTLDAKIASVASATAGVKWNIITTGLVLGGLFIAVAAFGVQILDAAQGLFSAGSSVK
ncbi:MAG: hypothetical protein AABY88_05990 [Pseudomonadota bacterium]